MRAQGRSNDGNMQKRFRQGATLAMLLALASGVAAAAGPDDRATAETVLKEVEASPRKALVSEMLLRAHAAEDRAAKLRTAGDEAHARLADGLARSWAETARDVLRAADVEDKARVARLAATDAGVSAERERALLEEGIAQSGRLRAQLEGAAHEAKDQPARTSAAANSDAGTPAPAPAPKRGHKPSATPPTPPKGTTTPPTTPPTTTPPTPPTHGGAK
jgi:hypothetical protein